MELLNLSREKLILLLQVINPDEINNFFRNTYQNKIGIFVKLISKVLMRGRNGIDEPSRRRLIVNQDSIVELTARIQGLQSEMDCMNDSRDFEDAESVRSGPSRVPSQPTLLPPHRDPKKC